MTRKIVILGPESTGKSTLCAQLAAHYNTVWVEEYARAYLLTNGTAYTYDDLMHIAKGQLALEDKAFAQLTSNAKEAPVPDFIFIDTNMYVLKVWCEFVFGQCHQWILDQVVARSYDLYLLCNIDLPWVKDELREYPDLEVREQLFHHYKDILVNQTTPWALISGTDEERLQRAIDAIEKLGR